MTIVFYITNHGYGHASRNVAIVQQLVRIHHDIRIVIKSDQERCTFMQRNLIAEKDNIVYYTDCTDGGLLLYPGTLTIDVAATKKHILLYQGRWSEYIRRETDFLRAVNADLVVTDVICWPVISAKACGKKAVVIGNFTWSSLYRSIFDDDTYAMYLDCYRQADLSIWYEIHDRALEDYTSRFVCVSLISRRVDPREVKAIRDSHSQPIIFVTLGASADLSREIDVSGLPYDFVATKGICLRGENVFSLPHDMINTQDYIAASEYVIAKGGWSTISEILLKKKKCCLMRRGHNVEDDITEQYLEGKRHCIMIDEMDLLDISGLIMRMKDMRPSSYDYQDSADQICRLLISEITGKEVENLDPVGSFT